jgi:isopenicillin N synthase-like dioxygenase
MTSEKLPTVDLAPFTAPSSYSDADRLHAGKAFATALHRYGFTKVAGHGVAKDEVDSAFEWNRKLFNLPHAEKMKAPHPPGPFPHRGYSGKIPEGELKESYEAGSEEDDQQQNIWLPEETLPGFRAYATSLYERLVGVADVLLHAMGVGLGLDENEQRALEQLASRRHSQLRFMHYPTVSKAQLQSEDEEVARLAAHNDWGYV